METKICSKCKKVKSIEEFYWRNDSNKYRNECKECFNLRGKERHNRNPEYSKIQSRKWRKENPEKANAICKKYRDTHKEKRLIVCTNWRINNPEKSNEIQKRNYTKRRKTPKGNLDHRMEVSIRRNLNGLKNGRKWEELVGYTVEDLKQHLEKQFKEGMTWSKFLKGKIHIDHIIPKSLFKYISPDDPEFKKCWALENLQPLWAEDNIRKHNKILVEV